MIETLTNQLIENISYFLLVRTNRVFYTLLTSISSTNIVFCGNSIGNKHWGSRQQYMVTISHTSIQITKLEFNQIHWQVDTQMSLPPLHRVDKYMMNLLISYHCSAICCVENSHMYSKDKSQLAPHFLLIDDCTRSHFYLMACKLQKSRKSLSIGPPLVLSTFSPSPSTCWSLSSPF